MLMHGGMPFVSPCRRCASKFVVVSGGLLLTWLAGDAGREEAVPSSSSQQQQQQHRQRSVLMTTFSRPCFSPFMFILALAWAVLVLCSWRMADTGSYSWGSVWPSFKKGRLKLQRIPEDDGECTYHLRAQLAEWVPNLKITDGAPALFSHTLTRLLLSEQALLRCAAAHQNHQSALSSPDRHTAR